MSPLFKLLPTSVTSSSVRRYYPRAFPYKADTQNIRRGLPSPWAASSQVNFGDVSDTNSRELARRRGRLRVRDFPSW